MVSHLCLYETALVCCSCPCIIWHDPASRSAPQIKIAVSALNAQVFADHGTDGHGQTHVADAPLLSAITAAEAGELRLPMPKNMVQAVRVAPRLPGSAAKAAGAAEQATDQSAAALRMVVTVPSRFCGVSVNDGGA